MSWERVYTVEDYYDCPRSGFADVGGKPHAYNCRFDHVADDWTNEYFTTEIDAGLLALVIEKWAIWQRWEEAFCKGKTSIDTHPTLADERPRYMTLKKAIEDKLGNTSPKPNLAKGNFRPAGQKPQFGWGNFEVEWTQIAK